VNVGTTFGGAALPAQCRVTTLVEVPVVRMRVTTGLAE
jgi:hypothetical protein